MNSSNNGEPTIGGSVVILNDVRINEQNRICDAKKGPKTPVYDDVKSHIEKIVGINPIVIELMQNLEQEKSYNDRGIGE